MSTGIILVISILICIALVVFQIKCANNSKVIISIIPMIIVFVIITGIFGHLYIENNKMEIKDCRYNLSNDNYAQVYIKFTEDGKSDVFSKAYIKDKDGNILDKLNMDLSYIETEETSGIYTDIKKYFIDKYNLKGYPLDIDQLKYIHKIRDNMVITVENKGIVCIYLLIEGPFLIIWLLIRVLKKYRHKKRELEKLQFELSIE